MIFKVFIFISIIVTGVFMTITSNSFTTEKGKIYGTLIEIHPTQEGTYYVGKLVSSNETYHIVLEKEELISEAKNNLNVEVIVFYEIKLFSKYPSNFLNVERLSRYQEKK